MKEMKSTFMGKMATRGMEKRKAKLLKQMKKGKKGKGFGLPGL